MVDASQTHRVVILLPRRRCILGFKRESRRRLGRVKPNVCHYNLQGLHYYKPSHHIPPKFTRWHS